MGEPDYMDEITALETAGGFCGSDGDEDELYTQAVDISNQKARLLQVLQKLQIGYNRAARIIDMMEEKGMK